MMQTLLSTGEHALLALLGLASFASLAIFIERFVYLRAATFDGRRELDRLNEQANAGTLDAYASEAEYRLGAAGKAVAAGIRSSHLGKAGVRETIDSARAFLRLDLERRVAVLGTVGSNAPFVGLLGTVLGIIQAFRDLAAAIHSGSAQPGAVMAGISTALVATAVGLIVAIPAVIFNNICRRRIARIERELDGLAHAVVAHAPDHPAPKKGG